MKKSLADLVDRYKQWPSVRGLVQLVPLGIGSAVDSYLVGKVEQYRHERLRCFFDELASGEVDLTPDVIESEDFLHAFSSTTSAVLRTRRREKINLFARLLHGAFKGSIDNVDEYEELLAILDELSFRELTILACLAKLERETRFEQMDNDLARAEKVWPEFERQMKEQLGLEPHALAPIMVRLQRSGCYAEITGGYWAYEGGRGRLTQLYCRLEAVLGKINADAV